MSKLPDRAEIEQLGQLRTEMRQRMVTRVAVARRKAAPGAIANGWKLEAEHRKRDALTALGVFARSRSTRITAAVVAVGLLSALGLIWRGKFGGGGCKAAPVPKSGKT